MFRLFRSLAGVVCGMTLCLLATCRHFGVYRIDTSDDMELLAAQEDDYVTEWMDTSGGGPRTTMADNHNYPEDNENYSQTSNETIDTKTILYWTTQYAKVWSGPMGSSVFQRCEYTACQLIGDKSKVKDVDMLLFFNMDPPNFPAERNPRQLYVHIDRDPPRHPSQTYLDKYEDQINLTANYRRDADIPDPVAIFQPRAYAINALYTPKIRLADRSRSVVWMVSHCETPSQRMSYVNELSKYIDVDIYGKCGNLTCPKLGGNKLCFQHFEKTYKFYLSFENRFCKDYYTEKLTNPMRVDLVPVVLGLGDYEAEIAPPHSVIEAKHFPSPKHLAQYLHRLSEDEDEYNGYFQWKQTHHLIGREAYTTNGLYCSLCKALHSSEYHTKGVVQPSYKRSSFGSYRKWWQNVCDHDLMDKIRQRGNW